MTDDVVVVGAGPTGLWLAAELALGGVPVTVLEREDRRGPYSKALGVHPRTLEVLAMRGAEKPFLEAGMQVPTWHYGMLESRLDFRVLDTPYPFLLGIPQARTEELFEERALDLGVIIRRSHTVTGLAQDDAGVTLEVSGPRGDEQRRTAYVVGCDGAGSVVRKAAGIGFPGTGATVGGLVADVVLDDPPPPGLARVTADGALIIAPAPGRRFRLGGYDPAHQDVAAPLTLDEVRDFLVRMTGGDFGLRSADWLSRFGNATRLASSYRAGRVLLAGDAAHMHFPTGGVGLNTGVQDAMNLGWKLAAVASGRSPATLLGTYHPERHPVGARVGADTQAQTALLTAITPEGLALRAVFNDVLAGSAAVNREFAERITALDVAYPAEGHALAGRRAPVSAELFGYLSAGRPVLLRAGGAHPVPARGWDGVAAAVVRPDGYVWWATGHTTPEAETAAMAGVLGH
jgi:2-polyprenyl-6-methoxyphenol hydroxylase-like FAD-dependent oxidoreductase